MYFNAHHHQKSFWGIYNLELKEGTPNSYFSVGLHPAEVTPNFQKDLAALQSLAQNPLCLAIGECGLDGLISVDETLQTEAFKAQIKLAEELNKPLIIHCVRLYYEIAKLCEKVSIPVIFHGYNKNETIAKMLIEKGFYLSFGHALLNRVSLQAVFKNLPLDRLLLETDDADIDIKTIYQKAATLKAMSLELLTQQIIDNSHRIFKMK